MTPASYLHPAYLLLGLTAVLLFNILTGLCRRKQPVAPHKETEPFSRNP